MSPNPIRSLKSCQHENIIVHPNPYMCLQRFNECPAILLSSENCKICCNYIVFLPDKQLMYQTIVFSSITCYHALSSLFELFFLLICYLIALNLPNGTWFLFFFKKKGEFLGPSPLPFQAIIMSKGVMEEYSIQPSNHSNPTGCITLIPNNTFLYPDL